MNSLLPDKPPEWLYRLEPLLEQGLAAYERLSPEVRIWFWIGTILVIALLCTGFVILAVKFVKALNARLQSESGWRPIRFLNCMWAGTGIYIVVVSIQMHSESARGWSLVLAIGAVIFGLFAWFLSRQLTPLRALGALVANSIFGTILAPIVIHLGFLAILAVIAFLAWLARRTQLVYVLNR